MRQCRTISASMERPHSPKTPSSPAAADTLSALLEDLGAQPRDFDCIVTGDLGHIGADLLLTLLRGDSIDLSPVYSDCGSLIFGDEQDAHAGGSGCGCSAAGSLRTAAARYASRQNPPAGVCGHRCDDESDLGAAGTADCRYLPRRCTGKERSMNYLNAFWVGGLICALCQVLIDKTKLTPARILVSLVVLGVILQGLGWYQAVVDYAGAGATVPLLGFGYSLAKGVCQSSCGKRPARRVHRRRDRCGRRHCRRDRVRLSVRAAVQTAIKVVKNNTPARNPPSKRECLCSQFFLYPITQITVIIMAHTTAAALTVRTLLTAPSACCRSSPSSHAGRK